MDFLSYEYEKKSNEGLNVIVHSVSKKQELASFKIIGLADAFYQKYKTRSFSM